MNRGGLGLDGRLVRLIARARSAPRGGIGGERLAEIDTDLIHHALRDLAHHTRAENDLQRVFLGHAQHAGDSFETLDVHLAVVAYGDAQAGHAMNQLLYVGRASDMVVDAVTYDLILVMFRHRRATSFLPWLRLP